MELLRLLLVDVTECKLAGRVPTLANICSSSAGNSLGPIESTVAEVIELLGTLNCTRSSQAALSIPSQPPIELRHFGKIMIVD